MTSHLDPGTTASLKILPLVDIYARGAKLKTEAGISWLIQTDHHCILFDTGFNAGQAHPSALLLNMERLGVSLQQIDTVVISANLPNHVGGHAWHKQASFALTHHHLDLSGKRAFAPVPLQYPGLDVTVCAQPALIGKGIMTTGAVSIKRTARAGLFEQALAVNVRGKGVVLVCGAGFQPLETLFETAESLFAAPIYALVGGRYYFAAGFYHRSPSERFLTAETSSPKAAVPRFFKQLSQDMAALRRRNPELVAISGHNSCDIVLRSLAGSFPEAFQLVRAGQRIVVSQRANTHPLVLVHGFTGWGRKEMLGFKYWGGLYDLQRVLREAGYDTHTAEVGPVSSNWDRACELFACIKGGRVDYGAAHAKTHGHERFGRFYPGLVPTWGAKDAEGNFNKVHLVGHSQGGQTVRVLAHLLLQGAPEELKATPEDQVSPLFKGGHPWVHSISTLATPHDGTTLAAGIDHFLPFMRKMTLGLAAQAGVAPKSLFYDFKLDHWGLKRNAETSFKDYLRKVENSRIWQSRDISAWDLSPDGARELNQRFVAQPGVYYFSWATADTMGLWPSKRQVPKPGMRPLFWGSAMFIGSFRRQANGGVAIDESWWENDGVVNTRSMDGPSLGSADRIVAWDGKPRPGSWNAMGVIRPWDHMDIVGVLNFGAAKPWFLKLAQRLGSLPD